MIKFRTKKLAKESFKLLVNKYGCLYDGHYNLIGFRSVEDETNAIKDLNNELLQISNKQNEV